MEGNRKDAPTPPAAAAAATTGPTLAEALYAVETLVQVFGFELDVANLAVDAVGTADVTQCYNYILDQGLGQDKGGAITPIDPCEHVISQIHINATALPVTNPALWPCCYTSQQQERGNNNAKCDRKGQLKADYTSPASGQCPLGENWLCLGCGDVYCSRYVNGHGLQHWYDTKQGEEAGAEQKAGHCLQVSLADLSVWCHVCQAYLKTEGNPVLRSIVQKLQNLKFPSEEKLGAHNDVTPQAE